MEQKNSFNFKNVLLVIVITIIDATTNSTHVEKVELQGTDKNETGVFTRKGV